jgi:hypothetical protein
VVAGERVGFCRDPLEGPAVVTEGVAGGGLAGLVQQRADSLSNLGVRFSEPGRPADALPAEQEAVAIRRELAAAMPGPLPPQPRHLAVQPRFRAFGT